jgi:hypothetical protein
MVMVFPTANIGNLFSKARLMALRRAFYLGRIFLTNMDIDLYFSANILAQADYDSAM